MKFSHLIVVLWAMTYLVDCTRLVFSKDNNIITLFFPENDNPKQQSHQNQGGLNAKGLNFQIDFTSKQLRLSKNLLHSSEYFFLNRHKKYKIKLKQLLENSPQLAKNVKFDFDEQTRSVKSKQVVTKNQKQKQQLKISGKIGLLPQKNVFMELIKKNYDQDYVQLFLNSQTEQINILYEPCEHIQSLPSVLGIINDKFVLKQAIRQLTYKFIPNKQFQTKILQKNSVPFILTEQQLLQKQIKIEFNNKIKNVPLKKITLPFCEPITESGSYSCQFSFNEQIGKINYGGLLMQFDISICQNGFLTYSNNIQPEMTYYILHYLMLIMLFVALLGYFNEEIAFKIVKNALKRKQKY